MKTSNSLKAVTLGLMAAFAVSAPNHAVADDLNITVVAGHPSVFRWVKHINQTFIPAVNSGLKANGHSASWNEQYGGALAKVGGELEATEEGLAEIALVLSLFEPAKLGVQNISYFTPFVSQDPSFVAGMMDDLQKSDPDMKANWENNDLEYLGGGAGVDDYFLMTNFPITSLADLEGRKIGAPGPAVNWVKGTGAVGVSGNLTTYYNDIKTGVYDGAILFATAAVPSKLYEVAPYITRIGFGAQYAGGLAANKDWFDSLDLEQQQTLYDAADDYQTAYHADLEASVIKFTEILLENGAIITDADEAFREKWAFALDNVAQAYVSDITASGIDGAAVLSQYMTLMREAGATPVRNWDSE